MTTEDDFQAALDANPSDWQTRLVFADWLDEREYPCPRCAGTGSWRGYGAQFNPGACDHCIGGTLRGDPRGPGYRALGTLRRVPRSRDRKLKANVWQYVAMGNPYARAGAFSDGMVEDFAIADDWISAIKWPCGIMAGTNDEAGWREFVTRREAEDAAALAFAQLPADRRAELLATVPA